MGWWDDEERTNISEKLIEDKALRLKLEEAERSFIKIKDLHTLCPKPKKGEQWRIITEKQMNAYTIIRGAIEEDVIEELYIAIYRINAPIVDNLIDLLESGRILKAHFVISNFFNQTKRPEQWAKRLKDYCAQHDNTSHIYTHNHSKVCAFKVQGGGYFVFEGSGNMSDNARIEQYLYEQSKEAFDFHKGWMEDLIKKYGQQK